MSGFDGIAPFRCFIGLLALYDQMKFIPRMKMIAFDAVCAIVIAQDLF